MENQEVIKEDVTPIDPPTETYKGMVVGNKEKDGYLVFSTAHESFELDFPVGDDGTGLLKAIIGMFVNTGEFIIIQGKAERTLDRYIRTLHVEQVSSDALPRREECIMEKQGVIKDGITPPELVSVSLKEANQQIKKENNDNLEDCLAKRASDKLEEMLK